MQETRLLCCPRDEDQELRGAMLCVCPSKFDRRIDACQGRGGAGQPRQAGSSGKGHTPLLTPAPSPRALLCTMVFGNRDFNSMWLKSSWSSASAVPSPTHSAVAEFQKWVRDPRVI